MAPIKYVYVRSEETPPTFTVGHFDASGKFRPHEGCEPTTDPVSAAAAVVYLNRQGDEDDAK